MDDIFLRAVGVLVPLVAIWALYSWWAIRLDRRDRAARAKERDEHLAALAHEQHFAALRGDAFERTAGEWAAGTLVFSGAALVVGGLAFVIGLFVAQFIAWFFAFWYPLVVVLTWLSWLFVGMVALVVAVQAAASKMDSMSAHRLQHGKKQEVA